MTVSFVERAMIIQIVAWAKTSSPSGTTSKTIRTSISAIDFAGLLAAFDGRFSVVRTDIRRDHGEQRSNMIAEIAGFILNITFTPRGEKYRIIPARLANRKERRLHHAQRQDS